MENNIKFNDIAKSVLSKNQQKLGILLQVFSETHFLGGGTAIALYLGHRESIDFDFFNFGSQGSFSEFIKKIGNYGFDVSKEDKMNFAGAEFEVQDEIHVKINGVNFSCINFFRTLYNDQKINIKGENFILGGLKIASLDELACMKVFAMITRKKWKDAVDLYFIIHNSDLGLESILEISEKKIFYKHF